MTDTNKNTDVQVQQVLDVLGQYKAITQTRKLRFAAKTPFQSEYGLLIQISTGWIAWTASRPFGLF